MSCGDRTRPKHACCVLVGLMTIICSGCALQIKEDPTAPYLPLSNAALTTHENLTNAALDMQAEASKLLSLKNQAADARAAELGSGSAAQQCRQDFNAPCPQKWTSSVDMDGHSVCKAPNEYNGFCRRTMRFDNMGTTEKTSLALECNIQWPCLNDKSCDPDTESYPCPEAFTLLNATDVLCYPDMSRYHGTCLSPMNFLAMTALKKLEWANACGTKWPCKEKEKQEEDKDFAPCPQKWIWSASDASCFNPQLATGMPFCRNDSVLPCITGVSVVGHPCSGRWRFTYWTTDMKRQFAATCGTTWVMTSCPYNFEALCPRNWVWVAERETCVADVDEITHKPLNSCGIKEGSFVGIPTNRREEFARKCNVAWPCALPVLAPQCTIDWTGSCPYEWKWSSTLSQCEPSESVENKNKAYHLLTTCIHSQSFSTFSTSEKRKWASQCAMPWACERSKSEKRKAPSTAPFPLEHKTIERPVAPHVALAQQPPTLYNGLETPGGPVDAATGKIISGSPIQTSRPGEALVYLP